MEDSLPFEKRTWKVLIKKEAKTDPQYGCNPEKRPIQELIQYGIINVNKPSGPTSHQVADYAKKIFGVSHAGHSGTLDPKVTGVLPIALAKATRITQTLLTAGKEYIALMHVHKDVPEKKLRNVIKKFQGKIEQMPPVRSAVKRQRRMREIYYLNILEIDGKDVLFKVGCQAGTYIRKLIFDIGQMLGSGAHMAQLVRTKAGPFSDATWHSLQEVRDALEFSRDNQQKLKGIVLPFESAVAHLRKVWVFDSAVSTVCHGSSLGVPGVVKVHEGIVKGETVAVMTLKDELICLGTAVLSATDMVKKDKGLAVTCSKVFMDRSTYPKKITT